jgi:hypothetical protein
LEPTLFFVFVLLLVAMLLLWLFVILATLEFEEAVEFEKRIEGNGSCTIVSNLILFIVILQYGYLGYGALNA